MITISNDDIINIINTDFLRNSGLMTMIGKQISYILFIKYQDHVVIIQIMVEHHVSILALVKFIKYIKNFLNIF